MHLEPGENGIRPPKRLGSLQTSRSEGDPGILQTGHMTVFLRACPSARILEDELRSCPDRTRRRVVIDPMGTSCRVVKDLGSLHPEQRGDGGGAPRCGSRPPERHAHHRPSIPRFVRRGSGVCVQPRGARAFASRSSDMTRGLVIRRSILGTNSMFSTTSVLETTSMKRRARQCTSRSPKMTDPTPETAIETVKNAYDRIRSEVQKVIVGQEEVPSRPPSRCSAAVMRSSKVCPGSPRPF